MAELVVPAWIKKELEGVNQHIERICHSRVKPMQRMMDSILSAKGKQIRPILTISCSRLTGKKPDVKELAAAIEICHTASLIHDDIIDEGEVRRGLPSIQKQFGKEMAVYAGDFMIFSAIGRTRLMNKLWYREMFDKLETMCDGEVNQFENRHNTELTETEYISYIKGKTSSMFEIACLSGARAAHFPNYGIRAMRKFSEDFGVLFQLRDDLLDFISTTEDYRKTVASDFINGYYTLPVICAMNNSGTADRIKEIARDRSGKTHESWEEIVQLVTSAEGFVYTRDTIREYAEDALSSLEVFPESASKQFLIEIVRHLCESVDIVV